VTLFDPPSSPRPRVCPTCGQRWPDDHEPLRSGRPVARNSDPETSHEAASSVVKVRERQLAVQRLLRDVGPMTDEQIVATYATRPEATSLKQSPSGLRTRRAECVELGLVEWTGERRTMTTGRAARVWRAVDDEATS
jgi:hypothetical protein